MFSRITPEQKQEELIRKFACSNYSTQEPQEIRELTEIIQKAMEKHTSMTVFIEYFEKGCEKHQTLNASGKLRSMGATGKSDEALLGLKEKLDRALDAEKGVPGIAYCSGVLLSNKFSSYDGIRIKGANTYCASGDDHVSIVVNRRPGKNGCEYLIRNTYGVSCNSYSWPCKNGQVWIPEKELLKNLKGVLWVE